MRTALQILVKPPTTSPRSQFLIAVVAALAALAARAGIDPWLGDRHEFLPLVLAVAIATWMATWRAGALAAVLFYAAAETLFGTARSAADASLAHVVVATLTSWLICAAVIFVVQHARQVFQELQDRVARLNEADHRKSDFMALLAHELRNPLSVLSTGTGMIRQGRLDPHALDGAWEAVERQTAHMKRLVGDLLDTSRIEQGKLSLARETVDIAALLADAIADAQTFTRPKRQRVQLAMTPRPGCASVDPLRIRQVLDNLLHNASKFSPPGALVSVSLTTSVTELTITVRDSGKGIPTAQLQTIFDSFVQLGSAGERAQGLGLGLALCRRLVELHGGSIQARSAGRGCGAEFTVRLPRPPELASVRTAREPAKVGPAATTAAGAARRVLVVDDTEDAAESLAILLQLAGYETAVAYDGRSALAAALAQRPDVVLLDMRLPDMTGLQVAQRLRGALAGNSPMFIGMSGMDPGTELLPPGFSAYLVKPFQFADLHAALTAAEAQPL